MFSKSYLSLYFSHEYSFGEQKELLNSTESYDEVSILLESNTSIPLRLAKYDGEVTIPFDAFAKMFYNVSIEGTLNKENAYLAKKQSVKRYFSYTFGNLDYSVEDVIKKEENKKFIPSVWDWSKIKSNFTDLNVLKNGFAVKMNGEFVNKNSTIMAIDIGVPS